MEKATEVFVRYMKECYCITIESPMVELRDGWEAVHFNKSIRGEFTQNILGWASFF